MSSSRRTAHADDPIPSSSSSTPASSTTAATGRSPPTTRRPRRRTSCCASPFATRGRSRPRSTCCRRSGSATRGRGTRLRRDRRSRLEAGTLVAEHPELGRRLPLGERLARAALLRQRDEQRSGSSARRTRRRTRRTGSTTTSCAARPRSTPAQTGTKAAFRYRLEVAAGATAVVELRLRDGDGGLGDDFAAMHGARREREADEFYAELTPAGCPARRGARAPPGARGDALVEAVLPLRRCALARRRSGRTDAARRAADRPKRGLAAPRTTST